MKAVFDIYIIFFSFYEIFLYFLTGEIIIVKYENGFRFHAFCIHFLEWIFRVRRLEKEILTEKLLYGQE